MKYKAKDPTLRDVEEIRKLLVKVREGVRRMTSTVSVACETVSLIHQAQDLADRIMVRAEYD